jgi:hypothetical protein
MGMAGMTWRSFVDYVIMREMGHADAIQRNYAVESLNGSKPGIMLDRAYARMGFDQKNTARAFILPMIAAKLRNIGYTPPASMVELGHLVRQWYQWDRIRTEDLRNTFPLRDVYNPLI